MSERIIDISTDGRHLSVYRGFMIVEEKGEEITRIPLDDIAGLIICAHGVSYSNNLFIQLSNRNVPVVFCGSNFAPVSYLWSVEGHHLQSARIEAQLRASQPLNKQLWKQIISKKIENQANLLNFVGENGEALMNMAKRVRSGDPDNLEAQSARRYWQSLLGSDFRRDQDAKGLNSLLNYGYTVIRSAVARSIMASGLHPSLGIYHKNMYNAMRLVDDVMEPYRPFVDKVVYRLSQIGEIEIIPETKKQLADVLENEINAYNGVTSLRNAIINTATSLALVYQGESKDIFYPSL